MRISDWSSDVCSSDLVDERSSMQMDVEARARQIVADMGGHWRGSYGMVCCPAHNDRNPSLQVTPGKKAVLFKCWAGCSQEAVWSALNSRKINRHTSGERSEEHTSELQSLMRIYYAVFCLKKKNNKTK